MQVVDMMQTHIVTATPDMSLAQAQRHMHDHCIRHLPVVVDTALVGLVSDRDIRDVLPSPATTLSKGEILYQMDTVSIKTCMTENIVTIPPEADAVQVALRLLDSKFGCLPVVDRGQLVGIVTDIDFLRGFLAAAAPAGEFMQVKDYMRTELYTVAQDDPVSAAYQRMYVSRIRHLPVVEEGQRLVGIITDRDIRQVHASDDPHLMEYELMDLLRKMTVRQAMTRHVITVREDTPMADAGQLLLDHRFGGLPVIRDDMVLVGIVTVADLIRAYVQQHEVAR
jgi:CBS domain-containing protein